MKKFCLLSTLLLISIALSGQTTKTYTGSYHGGQATYSYVEQEDGSRLYQGDFSWKKTIDDRSITAKGKFVDGKRDGLWVFTASQQKSKSLPASETLRVVYENGQHSGEYSYKASANYNGKGASSSFVRSDITKAPEGMVFTATCKNNLFDGKCSLSSTEGKKWEVSYDASGSPYYVGTWKFVAEYGTYYYDRRANEQYSIDSQTGERQSRNSSCWGDYRSSIKARCIDLEAFCEPYPETSGRYEPIPNY